MCPCASGTNRIASSSVHRTAMSEVSAEMAVAVSPHCRSSGVTFELCEPMQNKTVPSSAKNEMRRVFSPKHYQFEIVREASFYDWKEVHVSAADLAKEGFYSMHIRDQACCHFCSGIITAWEAGDIPREEHRKHYPNCPFVMGSDVINIPKDGSETSNILEKFIRQTLVESRSLPHRKKRYQTDSSKISDLASAKEIQYPRFQNEQQRKDSFTYQCENFPSIASLVDAGFFLVGFGDMTQCYSCSGGVFNWRQNENPIHVHDELYPDCLLSIKRNPNHSLRRSSRMKRPESIGKQNQILELKVPQKLSKGGWSSDIVSQAFWKELEQYGYLPMDINGATDLVSDYEDMLEDEKYFIIEDEHSEARNL